MARTVLPSWAVRVLMRRYIVSGMSKVVLMRGLYHAPLRRINMDLLIYGRRVERDAPWGTPARSSTTLKTDFAVFRRLPLIEPYVQFSRIRLSVWDP